MRASGGLFGIGARRSTPSRRRATESSSCSRAGFLVEALKLTLFSDPHVHVEGVGARATRGAGGEAGYVLSIERQPALSLRPPRAPRRGARRRARARASAARPRGLIVGIWRI